MKKRIAIFLSAFVLLCAVAALVFVSADVSAQDDGNYPSPDKPDTGFPLPPPSEPGAFPQMSGGERPDRPLVFSQSVSPQPDTPDSPTAPVINVWYGTPQPFGQIGNPQQWVNILGNVSDLGNDGTLEYSLKGGPFMPLSVGHNIYRLSGEGDFNIEIDYADLSNGMNEVVIRADDGDEQTETSVFIDYTTGQTWPSNYTADWSTTSNIQDIAQIVDGHWKLDGNNVYIDEETWGYDRVIAIGDEKWTDYEVTVPITVDALDPAGYLGVSNGPAVGVMLRWQGHDIDPNLPGSQPRIGWQRLGAIGWYHWKKDLTEALELFSFGRGIGARVPQAGALEFGTQYIFKMSVESDPPNPAWYRLKVWKASDKEPANWDLEGYGSATSTEMGSLLLVAHHVKAQFGKVTVKNLPDIRYTIDATIGTGEGEIVIVPEDQDDYAYGERVFVYAVPAVGYDFQKWTGDITGTADPADFKIYKDTKMIAHFVPKPPVKLNVDIEGDGTVQKDPNKPEYDWNEMVTLTAVPGGDQIFLRWEGDATGIQNPTKILMDDDKNVTAVFGPKSEASPRSDDFSGCELNTNIWDVINPAGDATFTATGKFAKFDIPGGSRHDMWSNNSDALRIMQPTNDQNFEIVAKWETMPEERFQMEGILIQQDPDNWLRFDFYHNGTGLIANISRNSNGATNNVKFGPADPGNAKLIYMKVARNGDNWTNSYSFNGTDWTTFAMFLHDMTVTSSGLFAGNAAQDPGQEPAFVARADYFFNTAAPIDPEDQGNTINVATIGQGQVQVKPVKSIYECGEQVTFTATAAPEWAFAGWSGDLNGGENPAVVNITSDMEVTATFSQGLEVFMPTVMTAK